MSRIRYITRRKILQVYEATHAQSFSICDITDVPNPNTMLATLAKCGMVIKHGSLWVWTSKAHTYVQDFFV